MNTFEQIVGWGDKHHPAWVDLFRVALGIMLIVKGIQPLISPENISIVSGGISQNFLSIAILHYIVLTHVVGGIMVALGLSIRIPLLLTFPILILAIVFAGVPEMGIFYHYAHVLVSIALLLANIAFLIYGSGAYSLDNFMRKHPNS
ncbi:MAG: DoxX family membrane protein [Bacteroidetes bacterium]|nr:DoxX family membrane protein [Bacteroidota bacterium]HET6245407.1 DoxX family membrane protein [Bacteroidia bacterium]